MPYTEAHQAIVESLLNLDIDDLSKEPATFKKQVSEIKKALTIDPERKETKESSPEALKSEFETVQRCYQAPEKNINRLEHLAGPIQVGELKLGMLQFIQTKFVAGAQSAGTTLDWEPLSAAAAITEEEKSKAFKTIKVPTASSSPLDIPVPHGVNYTITNVEIEEDSGNLIFELNIQMAEDEVITETHDLGEPRFSGSALSLRFVASAQRRAKNEAIGTIINELIKRNIIDDLEADQIPAGTKNYLIYPYFLQRILAKEQNIFDLYSEDLEEADRIIASGALAYLEAKRIDIDAIRLASRSQLKVLGEPFF